MVTVLTIPLPVEEDLREITIALIATVTRDADERTRVTDCVQIETQDFELAQRIKKVMQDFEPRQ